MTNAAAADPEVGSVWVRVRSCGRARTGDLVVIKRVTHRKLFYSPRGMIHFWHIPRGEAALRTRSKYPTCTSAAWFFQTYRFLEPAIYLDEAVVLPKTPE
jgi:hypothetical protein